MNAEIADLLLPLALTSLLAFYLSSRLGLPRLVVRVALMGPPAKTGVTARATQETVLQQPPGAAPRACEVRLAKNLHAWRERRRQPREILP